MPATLQILFLRCSQDFAADVPAGFDVREICSTMRTGIAQIESARKRRTIVGIGINRVTTFTLFCEEFRMLKRVPDNGTDEIRRISNRKSEPTAKIHYIKLQRNEIEAVNILPLLIVADDGCCVFEEKVDDDFVLAT